MPLLGRGPNNARLVVDEGLRVVTAITPTYPAIAKSARVKGRVEIEVVVESDGHVSGARVTRSIPFLTAR